MKKIFEYITVILFFIIIVFILMFPFVKGSNEDKIFISIMISILVGINLYEYINRRREYIKKKCLRCGKKVRLKKDSLEGTGVFNVFCSGDCEDEY